MKEEGDEAHKQEVTEKESFILELLRTFQEFVVGIQAEPQISEVVERDKKDDKKAEEQ